MCGDGKMAPPGLGCIIGTDTDTWLRLRFELRGDRLLLLRSEVLGSGGENGRVGWKVSQSCRCWALIMSNIMIMFKLFVSWFHVMLMVMLIVMIEMAMLEVFGT